MKFGPLICLALVLSVPALSASKAGKLRKQIRKSNKTLEQTRQRLEQERQKLGEEKRREGDVLTQLGSLNAALASAKVEWERHQANLRVLHERQGELSGRISNDRVRVFEGQQALGRRLRTLYRQGPLEPAVFLLSSSDPAQLMTRARALKWMAGRDAGLVTETRSEMQSLGRARTDLVERERQIQEERNKAAQAERQVAAKKAERQEFLAGLRKEKDQTAKAIQSLQQRSDELQSMLERLAKEQKALQARPKPKRRPTAVARKTKGISQESSPDESSEPEPEPPSDQEQSEAAQGPASIQARGGNRPLFGHAWPLEGRLLSRFGKQRHPQLGTWVFNRGIEIGAAPGAAFRSVAAGRVIFSGAFTRFGNMVVLDHGRDTYTVYGYAGGLEVSRGQSVSAGQVLGQVGPNGSLGDPALFFEVTVRGKAVDPLPWVRLKSKRRRA
jgi:septal ring factor EnvC (AmiA/AmiB activator)